MQWDFHHAAEWGRRLPAWRDSVPASHRIRAAARPAFEHDGRALPFL